MTIGWRPTAELGALHLRAAVLARVREFFTARAVLEVETPILVNHPVTDPNLQSVELPSPIETMQGPMFLQTSPEYAMKRLLASGSGDIYQVCKVFRASERGRLHNPEFTLIEWYRLGLTLEGLMAEVAALTLAILATALPEDSPGRGCEYLSYQEALQHHAGIDPLSCDARELAIAASAAGLSFESIAASTRDDLLDFLVSRCVGPRLGHGRLTFLHRYPRSQAALARVDPTDPRVALRFELYADGIELANGFHELADAADQRARFAAELLARARLGLPTHPVDEGLLAALQHGLPDCCGVAVGLDRVLMVASGAQHIDAVLALPMERA
ncbi:MAG: EF-P lysine aminoacylase GenX [Proteobacteria bacterium]|nr:EF-P lysine aminoacylase GenX [Pseudomonadota bacterium]